MIWLWIQMAMVNGDNEDEDNEDNKINNGDKHCFLQIGLQDAGLA